MTDTTTDSILFALYCLCRDNKHVDATELALAASISPTLAAGTLVQLERTGLVDASRARLTMLGLARACQLQASGAGGQGGPRVSLGHSRPRVQRSAVPVAAKSQVPAAPTTPERPRVRTPEVAVYLQAHA